MRGMHSIDHRTVTDISYCDQSPMQQLELTYAQENPAHDIEIEAINAEAFGPARFTKAAHFIREGGPHDLNLSFVALMGGIVVGSVRQTPVMVGKKPALVLGPLAVRPEWKKRGIGGTLMRMSIEAAQNAGHKLIVLVGDEPYYAPFGFKMVQLGSMIMPAPVDPRRMLACELAPNALNGATGIVRHASRV